GRRRWTRSSPPGIARKSERSLRPMVSSCGRWGCDDRCWFPSLRSGGGTTPHTPRVSAYRRRQWVAPVKEPGPFADRVGSLPTTYHLPPTTRDSLASLGWGDDPPYPPSVGVPASSVGRARQRTRTVRGSRRVASYHLPPTTYHLPLPPPDWRTRTDSRSM